MLRRRWTLAATPVPPCHKCAPPHNVWRYSRQADRGDALLKSLAAHDKNELRGWAWHGASFVGPYPHIHAFGGLIANPTVCYARFSDAAHPDVSRMSSGGDLPHLSHNHAASTAAAPCVSCLGGMSSGAGSRHGHLETRLRKDKRRRGRVVVSVGSLLASSSLQQTSAGYVLPQVHCFCLPRCDVRVFDARGAICTAVVEAHHASHARDQPRAEPGDVPPGVVV